MSRILELPPIRLDVDEVLRGIGQLEPKDLDWFVQKVLKIQADKRAPSMRRREADLLQKINQGVPVQTHMRFEELNDKLHEETITPVEHQELLELIDQIELADARRMKYLSELARLRKVSLRDLMRQLGMLRSTNG